MSNKIYRYSWKGVKTGWDYRMDVSPASATALSNPEIIEIPPGAFEIKSRKVGHDVYPVGAQVSQMSVFWDLTVIPDDEVYSDLLDALLTPRLELSRLLCSDKAFTTGTLYRYYIKFNGNDSSPQYREVFSGIQENGIEKGYEFETNYFTTLVENALYYALKNTVFDKLGLLIYSNPPKHISKTSCIEFMYPHSGFMRIFGHWPHNSSWGIRAQDTRVWFYKLEEIWTYIAAACEDIYRKITRSSDPINIGLPLTQHFRQQYAGDGAKGSQLAFNQLYIIGVISNAASSAVYEGLFLPNLPDYIGNDGRNAWDFLSDFTKEHLHKMHLDDNSLWMIIMFNAQSVVELGELTNYNKFNFLYEQDKVNRAVSSMYEQVGDDIPKYEDTSGEGRDSGGYTIPVSLLNHPVADLYSYYRDVNLFNSSQAYKSHYTNTPHLWGLWYFEASSSYFTQSMPVRIHEHIRTPYAPDGLGGYLYTDELEGCGFTAWGPGELNASTSKAKFLDMQLQSCKPRSQAKAFRALFGKPELGRIELEVDYNILTQFGSGQPGFVWDKWGFYCQFNIDLTTKNSHIKGIPTKWVIISTELNDIDETAKVTLIPRCD